MVFHDLRISLTSTHVLWCDNIGALALASVNQPAHKNQEGNITTDTPKPLREISCTKMERIATSFCI
jgi:hypothetical protein